MGISPPSPPRVWLPVGTYLACGLVLALWLYLLLAQRQADTLQREFANLAERRMQVLENHMARSLEILHSLAAVMGEPYNRQRDLFRAYVAGSFQRLPELQVLEWIPLVDGGERAGFEAGAREQGLEDYRIIEFDDRGALGTAGPRERYFPVLFAFPETGNWEAVGLDLGSQPDRLAAIETVLKTGEVAATAPVRLAQEKAPAVFGVLILAPVYGYPSSPSSAIVGFALVAYRTIDLLAAVFADMAAEGVDVRVHDTARPEILLYGNGLTGAEETALKIDQRFVFGQRVWQVDFTPTPVYLARHGSPVIYVYPLLSALLVLAFGVHAGMKNRYLARVEAEVQTRKAAQQEAASANAAKTRFLASIGHEIKTPLNAIIGYSQLLRRQPQLQEKHRLAVEAIAQSGNHLLGLIDDILDYSRLDAGRLELHNADFDLAALIGNVAHIIRHKCHDKGLRLRVEGLGSQPVLVHGDEGKLRQILINLLYNAIKYTPRGEVILRVVPEGQGCYRFEIIDTGPGIPAQDLERIFEHFYQRGHWQEGAGLGLSIASGLARLMDSELKVRSKPGHGSDFFLRITFAPPRTGQVPTADPGLQDQPHCPAPVVDDATPADIPPDIAGQIVAAARYYNMTRLKQALAALAATSARGERLARRLRALADRHRLEEVIAIVEKAHPVTPDAP